MYCFRDGGVEVTLSHFSTLLPYVFPVARCHLVHFDHPLPSSFNNFLIRHPIVSNRSHVDDPGHRVCPVWERHPSWPSKTNEQRDSELNRLFQDGLSNTEMGQYLRLHARNCDFSAAVLKARQYVDAAETRRPKKTVRILKKTFSNRRDLMRMRLLVFSH